jgi:predicted  nucleic acid-binding Zn-ribbon protein
MPNSHLQDQLGLLHQLQQLELAILSLHQQRQAIPLKIANLEDELQVHQNALDAKKEALAEAERELRSKNAELTDQQEQRQKYETQLREVKTNKEYQALDNEIRFLQEKEAEIEDAILGIMLDIDRLHEELRQAQASFDAEKEKVGNRKATYEQEERELEAAVAAQQQERKRFSPDIDKDLMTGYQAWGRRSKTAFVSIVINNACGGCRIAIPPQTLKEARKFEKVVQCSSCKRILYPLPDEEKEVESE